MLQIATTVLRSVIEFDLLSRRFVLRSMAVGVILYSFLVLGYSNSVPHLEIEVLGRFVRSCTTPPAVGAVPNPGDRVAGLAGREVDSMPRFVNVLANLRNRDKYPPEPVASEDSLGKTTSAVCIVGERLFVRMDLEPVDTSRPRFSSWFEVRDPPWKQSTISLAWLAAESLVFWTGWLAFRRKPEDDASALFFLMCIVTVGAYMGGYHWLRISSSPALILVFAVCAMAVPQISLHFFLMFPRPKRFAVQKPLATLLALHVAPAVLQLSILLTIGSVIYLFRHRQPAELVTERLRLLWVLITGYLVLAGAMFSGCVACLIHAFWTIKQPVQRNQVWWILVGASLSTVFLGYAMVEAFVDPVGFALGNATWAMFVASIVFTWAYSVSILKYRLLDVQEILHRGMLYLMLSFLAGLLYYGLLLLTLWLAPHFFGDASRGQALFAPFAVLAVLLILGAVRSRFQKIVDRRFFREKQRLEKTVRQIGEEVGRLVGPKAAAERGLVVVVDALSARAGAIYSRGADGLTPTSIIGDFRPPNLENSHPLLLELEEQDLIQLTPERLFLGDVAAQKLGPHGIELVQSIRGDGELTGAIVLTGRVHGGYESGHLEFLQSFAEMLGLILATAGSQATLEKLNEELRDKLARLSRQTTQLIALQSQSGATGGSTAGDNVGDESETRPAPALSLVGSGKAMRELTRTVVRVAASPATVLIRGESGTGKTLLAEQIHRRSPRSSGPFVKVHCAALSPGLLESELFGHVKGAFTGAHRDKIGRFQLADSGTLFLDEIGDIPLELQTKLLRILQEMTFEPVGSNEPVKVNVRIIAATHQPLEELIRVKRFREDLFYRLNVISLWMPPLRDRQEDIVDLAIHFVRRFAADAGKRIDSIDDEALKILVEYAWPGNVRELENVIERAVVMASGVSLALSDLPAELVSLPPVDPSSRRLGRGMALTPQHGAAMALAASSRGATDGGGFVSELEEVERSRLIDSLRRANGNKSKAAALLGLPRSTFCSKLKKFGLI